MSEKWLEHIEVVSSEVRTLSLYFNTLHDFLQGILEFVSADFKEKPERLRRSGPYSVISVSVRKRIYAELTCI